MTSEPRETCLTCRRPASVCYCRHVRPVQTRTRVVLLQHPRERDVAIGTARMASLCLPGSELHVGVRWEGHAALASALSDPARPAALLYPGSGAIDVLQHPPPHPVTLVVVDGTWWQARSLVRDNPTLAALPRLSFTPPVPSQYRIRREPEPSYVSTIEALVYVLGALEGDPTRFHALLDPFRAMIDTQLEHEARHAGQASRHARRSRRVAAAAPVPACFSDRARDADIVCVHGEANAWPYGTPERAGHGDELVHWVATRPATRETLDVVLAPRHPLAAGTLSHTRLSQQALAAGKTPDELAALWGAFARDTDVVCTWGHYATRLFEGLGLSLPRARVDLRHAARLHARGKVGTLEAFVASLGEPLSAPAAHGRAHARLAHLGSIVRAFQRPAQ